MYKILITIFLLISTPVMAADLPVPPIRSFNLGFTPQMVNSYVTVNAGSSFNQSYSFGGYAGTRIYGPVYGEVSYDYINKNHKTDNRIMSNLIFMQPIVYGSVYGLVGAGYSTRIENPVWIIGIGYKLPLMHNVDMDIRYRYIARFDNRKLNDNQLTVGVGYKF